MSQERNAESAAGAKHRIWSFAHGVKVKEFGPYYFEDEAKSAFQRVYGYWPEPALGFRPWDGIFDNTNEPTTVTSPAVTGDDGNTEPVFSPPDLTEGTCPTTPVSGVASEDL